MNPIPWNTITGLDLRHPTRERALTMGRTLRQRGILSTHHGDLVPACVPCGSAEPAMRACV